MMPDLDLDYKIGQMLMVGFRGFAISQDSPIVQDICERHVGGLVLFDYDTLLKSPLRNIQSPAQTKRLIRSLQELSQNPLFIGIDQEGGKVNRLKGSFGFPATVSAHYLGQQDRLELTREYADSTARTLAELGINLNFAPVVDLDINPESPAIGKVERSFSEEPNRVVKHARVWIQQHHAHHILCALKHFPGHGSARKDRHLGFVDVTDTWSSQELLPYQNLIQEGFGDMVMSAHIFHANLDPDWPATLSHSILNTILRQEIAHDGVIISDDMQMRAISSHYTLKTAIYRAIAAGMDILTFGNNLRYDENIAAKATAIIQGLVSSGSISEERIEQSYQRICHLKERLLMKRCDAL